MHLFYADFSVVEVKSMDSVVNSWNESYGILLYVKYRSSTCNMGSLCRALRENELEGNLVIRMNG